MHHATRLFLATLLTASLVQAGDRPKSLRVSKVPPSTAEGAWTRQIGGTGPEIPFAVAGTADGAAVAGTFDFRLTLGADTLHARNDADAFVARFDRSGRPTWARALGGREGDQARGVAVEPNGDIVATGYFTDRLMLDGSVVPLSSRGGADVFAVRLDHAGRVSWARSWGGAGADTGLALASAPAGGVWITGGHQADASFGDYRPRVLGGRDAFLMRLVGDGAVAAFVSLGGPRDDEGRAVAVDAAGNAYWLGRYTGTAQLGATTLTASHRGSRGLFVARITPAGEVAWAVSLDSAHPGGIAVGPSGRVLIAGAFRDQLDLTALRGPVLVSAGSLDGFALCLTARGEVAWARSFGGTATDLPQALDVAPDGRVLVSGYFQGTSDFDPGPAVRSASSVDATNADAFLLTLTADGRYRDLRTVGGDGVEQGLALSAAGNGDVYLAGLFNDLLAEHGASLTSRGKTDAFLMRVPALDRALGEPALARSTP